ncbi:hypothetical protein PFLUV_G00059060 [Perca fluviatilis]|uniref:Uncharacterized protein n=1 Tax=Perca fluviatilis TaxID=8168 RepID=A0A6A5FHL4_PERFL|nr:hypothetical protein PFLUV_G00059060 [Perca fluviatilis]
MFPLLYCRTPVLSAGVRLGGHRAQGPGRHQGAAAALISPKPATTFSGQVQSPSGEKEQEAGELEDEETQNQGEEHEEKEDSREEPLHLTAAPSGRAPCSHRHVTTQGRFLQLHAYC